MQDNISIRVMIKGGAGPIIDMEDIVACPEHLPLYNGSIVTVHGQTLDPCHHCAENWNQRFSQLRLVNDKWLKKISAGEVIYLSGPMSGMPDLNRPAFRMMEHALKLRGARILTPAGADQKLPYETLLRNGLRMVLNCQTMVMLKGWQNSYGAVAEWSVGKITGCQIIKEVI